MARILCYARLTCYAWFWIWFLGSSAGLVFMLTMEEPSNLEEVAGTLALKKPHQKRKRTSVCRATNYGNRPHYYGMYDQELQCG